VRLVPDRVDVRGDALAVDHHIVDTVDGWRLAWSLANEGGEPVDATAVALVCRVGRDDTSGPLRMFRNGYQSWSPTGAATFGADADPSLTPGAVPLAVALHHADPEPAEPGELRSELVTALWDAAGGLAVAGFLGGSEHDGTFRLRLGGTGPDPELWIEAFLGGARLAPGERRALHDVVVLTGTADAMEDRLSDWAEAAGAASGARAASPFQAGWCSWYQYFHDVTEADIRANLTAAADGGWPFDVFQIDDGFQPEIGDWLDTNERFPSDHPDLAGAIAARGYVPGVWIAPFLASPSSEVAREHPGWFALHTSGRPLVGMVNPGWGGAVHTLDTTQPEVLDHLTSVAEQLVGAGYRYLKLDFTYAPALPGTFADPSMTPAQRVRAGFDAIRRGAGDDVFILGCGAPLGPTIGAVDGMRIGPDVAPWWELPDTEWYAPGYREAAPSTANALRSTVARGFMHRRLWLNDPDCVMLRTEQTQMTAAQVERWARAVGESGGMVLVSDDLTLLGADARRLLDEVLATGRAADAERLAQVRRAGRPG
jgi:alpha-galactosidase